MLKDLQDNCQPLMVIAEGLYDEGITTFRLAQDKIKNALAADPDGGDRLRLEMWGRAQRTWVQSPRNDTQYLLPGEGRIYRKRGVSAMPNFEGYAGACLPLCDCAIPWLPGDAGHPLSLRSAAPSTSPATPPNTSPATSPNASPMTSSNASPATSSNASSPAKRTGTIAAKRPVKRHRVGDIAVPHAGRKGKQVARSLSSMDVIELTDSEDDEDWPSSPTVRKDIIVISDSE